MTSHAMRHLNVYKSNAKHSTSLMNVTNHLSNKFSKKLLHDLDTLEKFVISKDLTSYKNNLKEAIGNTRESRCEPFRNGIEWRIKKNEEKLKELRDIKYYKAGGLAALGIFATSSIVPVCFYSVVLTFEIMDKCGEPLGLFLLLPGAIIDAAATYGTGMIGLGLLMKTSDYIKLLKEKREARRNFKIYQQMGNLFDYAYKLPHNTVPERSNRNCP